MGRLSVLNPDSVEKLMEYLDHHYDSLERIVTAVQAQTKHDQYLRLKSSVALDATGGGVIEFLVPQGFDYSLERITVTSGGNGQCQIFIGTQNPIDMVEVIGSSLLYSDAFSNNIFAASGNRIFVQFIGAGANGNAQVNLQAKLLPHDHHRLPPHGRVSVGDA